ncbi:MAG: nitroreductase family deazaflavin-dependent oxidoreductase [Marmoricola sp.]
MRFIQSLFTRCAILIGSWAWVPNYLAQITAVDKFIQRKTRGSWSLLRLAGLPGVLLTVPGRKTGVPRSTPLLCTPYGDGVLIAGSNFGGPKVPVWVGNLRAADRAWIHFDGEDKEVVAHELEGADRAEAWSQMLKTWPNYRLYEERIADGRTIPVFWLRPAA